MPSKDKESFFLPIGIFLVIVLVWVLCATATLFIFLGPNPSSWTAILTPGEFGDLFGSINALFSGLAFAGLIYTIILQRKELEFQRDELSLTRGEIQGQRIQLEQQTIALNRQNFENTFFQLMQFQRSITESMEILDAHNNQSFGRASFKSLLELLERRFSKVNDAQNLEEKVAKAYEDFYTKYQSLIGHYFRNLYHLISLVDTSENLTNKRLYTNLIRAQLSTNELVLLFYNCLSSHGLHTLKPLAEQYSLFKDLPEGLLLFKELKNQYNPSAFA